MFEVIVYVSMSPRTNAMYSVPSYKCEGLQGCEAKLQFVSDCCHLQFCRLLQIMLEVVNIFFNYNTNKP